MIHRTLHAAVAVAVLSAPAAGRQAPGGEGGPPPSSVRVAPVLRQNLQERRRVTGELRAVERSRVATMEEGLVLDLPVNEGQRVSRGEPLATLDRRRLEIELRRIEAQEAVARAITAARGSELELAQRDLDSLQLLESRGASNPKELADVRSGLAVAEARAEEARSEQTVYAAQADLLRTRLEDTVIAAPFEGVVIAVHTERGQWVDKGDPIVEIVSTGAFEVWMDVPQRFARWLMAEDAAVVVEVEGMAEPTPPLSPRVVPNVDPRARTFEVYALIDDPAGALAAGMSAIGWVPTGSRGDFLTVPRDAMLRSQGGDFVYAAQPTGPGAGMAAPVPVTVLFETADRVAVRSDRLEDGMLVVVEGNERLFPMMPLKWQASGDAVPPGER